MVKIILFDIYGMVIHREMRFSRRFSKEFNFPFEKLLPFFQNEFQLCLVGKADLKEELAKQVQAWQWQGTVDELLEYWFKNDNNINKEMLLGVEKLRKSGISCFLNTQNEKYLTDYVFNSLGLKKYFDGIFSTNEIGFKKSQREYWAGVHQALGNPEKQNVLCWDDDEKAVETAKSYGFSAELYTDFNAYQNTINKYIK